MLFPRRILPPAASFAFLAMLMTFAAVSGKASASRGLSPDPGSAYGMVWLEVDPSGADMALDGTFLDVGVWLLSVPPGSHRLSVRKPGFRPRELRFGVSPGERITLDIRLERETAGADPAPETGIP